MANPDFKDSSPFLSPALMDLGFTPLPGPLSRLLNKWSDNLKWSVREKLSMVIGD